VKKPEPVTGLVIRYDYLWRDEARRGRMEGAKERPCAIILASQNDENGRTTVTLAAITHSPPANSADALEIPAKVKQALGLDDARSWIMLHEVNSVDWGDPGIVPVTRTQWHYGYLPPKLARAVLERIVTRFRANKLTIVNRE
jgi:mRNA-degrading endonuclease toxin of MazEF toxin-antitoxin module